MKERPILFTGEMVRAILDGRKTQTRRPVKMPEGRTGIKWDNTCHEWFATSKPDDHRGVDESRVNIQPPFGWFGDRLWVRETFRIYRSSVECACYDDCRCSSMNGKPLFLASDPSPDDDKWTPSIHMPRWASRIDLEITAVRVERVADITEEDARKEGIETTCPCVGGCDQHRKDFRKLWQSIYGNRPTLPKNPESKRYHRVKRWLDKNPPTGWDANPWVWVYEFRRVKP